MMRVGTAKGAPYYSVFDSCIAFTQLLAFVNQWGVGCALTFASEAKFEIEAKISFRLEAKKSLISHDSLRCETPKT